MSGGNREVPPTLVEHQKQTTTDEVSKGSNGKSQCTNALFVSKSVFTNVVRKYGYSLKKKIAPSC